MLPMLERLAGAGFFAVSIDPWQHGERSTESPTHLRDRLIGAFRRDIWPVIDQSASDTMWCWTGSPPTTTCRAAVWSPAVSRSAATSLSRWQGSTSAWVASPLSGRHLTGHAPACATWKPATATLLTMEPPLLTVALYAQLNLITHPEHFAHFTGLSLRP